MDNKRTFLITGATKGIGLATAKRLHDKGHNVVGIARNLPREEFPGTFYSADLSDEAATLIRFNEIKDAHVIDGVVNNVGIAIPQSIEEISIKDFKDVMELNLMSALLSMQVFMPKMVDQGWGRIVNIASRAAKTDALWQPKKSAISWAKLIRKVYEVGPLKCEQCGETMKIIAYITNAISIYRILKHIGEETEPPKLHSARGPPNECVDEDIPEYQYDQTISW